MKDRIKTETCSKLFHLIDNMCMPLTIRNVPGQRREQQRRTQKLGTDHKRVINTHELRIAVSPAHIFSVFLWFEWQMRAFPTIITSSQRPAIHNSRQHTRKHIVEPRLTKYDNSWLKSPCVLAGGICTPGGGPPGMPCGGIRCIGGPGGGIPYWLGIWSCGGGPLMAWFCAFCSSARMLGGSPARPGGAGAPGPGGPGCCVALEGWKVGTFGGGMPPG